MQPDRGLSVRERRRLDHGASAATGGHADAAGRGAAQRSTARCAAPLREDQEWCLRCGQPRARASRAPPGGRCWSASVLVALLSIAGLTVALVELAGGPSRRDGHRTRLDDRRAAREHARGDHVDHELGVIAPRPQAPSPRARGDADHDDVPARSAPAAGTQRGQDALRSEYPPGEHDEHAVHTETLNSSPAMVRGEEGLAVKLRADLAVVGAGAAGLYAALVRCARGRRRWR